MIKFHFLAIFYPADYFREFAGLFKEAAVVNIIQVATLIHENPLNLEDYQTKFSDAEKKKIIRNNRQLIKLLGFNFSVANEMEAATVHFSFLFSKFNEKVDFFELNPD